MFDGFGLQGQPEGSLVRNKFDGLFTEEKIGAGKIISE